MVVVIVVVLHPLMAKHDWIVVVGGIVVVGMLVVGWMVVVTVLVEAVVLVVDMVVVVTPEHGVGKGLPQLVGLHPYPLFEDRVNALVCAAWYCEYPAAFGSEAMSKSAWSIHAELKPLFCMKASNVGSGAFPPLPDCELGARGS